MTSPNDFQFNELLRKFQRQARIHFLIGLCVGSATGIVAFAVGLLISRFLK